MEEPITLEINEKILGKISISGVHLSPNDLVGLSATIEKCDHLSILELINCHLDFKCVQALAHGLKGSSVEIDVLDVSFNRNLRADSLVYLYDICQRTQGLNYWQCGFKQLDLLTFKSDDVKEGISEIRELTRIETVEMDFNESKVLDLNSRNVQDHLNCLKRLAAIPRSVEGKVSTILSGYKKDQNLRVACDIINGCSGIRELGICECVLSAPDVEMIYDAVCNKEIDILNVFLNHIIETAGWEFLGKIVKQCKIKNLFLTACSLSEGKLRKFLKSVHGIELHKLDVSRNDNMSEGAMQALAEMVELCQAKEVVMGYCRLTTELMKPLKEFIVNSNLNRLDVSGNDTLGVNGFGILGEITDQCQVKLLDVSECDPSPQALRKFRENVGNAKITKLNVSRNRNMGVNGLEDVGKLVGQCQLKELFIRQCGLEVKTLSSLQRGLGDAMIPSLDLGYYFMTSRKTTREEIDVLAGILTNVTEVLTLNKWEVGDSGRQVLQDAMDNLPYRGLKIQFNRGGGDVIQQKSRH